MRAKTLAMAMVSSATAIAHANIALVKYWGKRNQPGNYPAVPSLSLTLDRLQTETQVAFDDQLSNDELLLGGVPADGKQLERVTRLLDAVRAKHGLHLRARVISRNNFPTASGLASSASGFAALALAATAAAAGDYSVPDVSALARAASASAARSVLGGWAQLDVGAEAAEPVEAAALDVALLIAVTDKGQKAVSSTAGMNLSSSTSPVYPTWLQQGPSLFLVAKQALRDGNFAALGQAMEQSTWLMHSTMLTTVPALIYLAPASLQIIKSVQTWRGSGIPAYFTTDAGPHVKVLTHPEHAADLKQRLLAIEGVLDVIVCAPGPAAAVTEQHNQAGCP